MNFENKTNEEKAEALHLLKYAQDSGDVKIEIPNRMRAVYDTLENDSTSWKARLILDKIDEDGIESWGIPENELYTHNVLAHISYITAANGAEDGRPVIHYRAINDATLAQQNKRAKELNRQIDINSTDIQPGRLTTNHDIIVLHVPEKVLPKVVSEYKAKEAAKVTKRKPAARKSLPKTAPKTVTPKTDVKQDKNNQ